MLASTIEPAQPLKSQTPKITYQVSLQQILNYTVEYVNREFVPSNQKYARVANVQVEFAFIKKTLIGSSLDRTFAAISNYVKFDLNPESRAEDYDPIDVASPPTNEPKISLQVNTDDTEDDEIVNVSLTIIGVKIEFLDATFSRVRGYIFDSIATDLNP